MIKTRKNIMLDLSSLPKTRRNGKEAVDWKEVKNRYVHGKYYNIDFTFILDYLYYKGSSYYISLKYRNNKYVITNSNLLKLQISHIFKYNVGEVVESTSNDINHILFRKNKFRYPVGYRTKSYEIVRYKVKALTEKEIEKSYVCRCLVTGEEFIRLETNMKNEGSPFIQGNNGVYEKNSLYTKRPDLRMFIKDLEFAKKVREKSDKYIVTVCPNCGNERKRKIIYLSTYGFSCNICSSNVSYPERIMSAVLNYNHVKYDYQKVFNGLPKKRFDFYLPDYNMVIETHGEQHYNTANNSYFDYKTTHRSDLLKEKFCRNNKIQYVSVDCKKSSYEYITNNIIDNVPLDLKICKDVIIENINNQSFNNDFKDIINMYKKGESLCSIAKKYNRDVSYISNLVKRAGVFEDRTRNKKVQCITTGQVFDGVREATREVGLSSNASISIACRNKYRSAGKHPETGEKLYWKFI